MQSSSAVPEILECLSDRLLQRQEGALWRHVFLGPAAASVRVERVHATLLCTDAPAHGWQPRELSMLADRFHARVDSTQPGTAWIAFDDPAAACRAALLIQQIGADSGVRVALTESVCDVASFERSGRVEHMLLAEREGECVQALQRATPAAVIICAPAYPQLEKVLEEEGRGIVVTIEETDDLQCEACVSLLPLASQAQSTFAGLGRL